MNSAKWLLALAFAASSLTASDVRIDLDPGHTLGKINPLIFGNNQLGYDMAHIAATPQPKVCCGLVS